MTTDLFAIMGALDPVVVERAIPPACRGAIQGGGRGRVDGPDAVIESPVWIPRRPARHFVPSLSVPSDTAISFRTELSIQSAGRWSPWVASASIGPASFPPVADRDESPGSRQNAAPVSNPNRGLLCDVDVFTADVPATAVRARARVRDATSIMSGAWLFTLSASDLEPGSTERSDAGGSTAMAVPVLSQMDASAAVARRICSPACVAMVLRYWGHVAGAESLAAEMFHPSLDLYGVWPAAIAAAARRRLGGYLLRFPDWNASRWCLDAGLPIIASIRYAAGELTGAAIAETSGHLVVVTGYDGDAVLVNDPAASPASRVARRYARDEFEHVWLARAGVGYVFFPLR